MRISFADSISILGVVVSLFSALFAGYAAIYPGDVRSWFGDGQLKVRVGSKMAVSNNIHGLLFSPEIHIENIGHDSIYIDDIIVGISREHQTIHRMEVLNYENKSKNQLNSPSSFELRAGFFSTLVLNSRKPLLDEEYHRRERHSLEMYADLSSKYLQEESNLEKKIFLSDENYKAIESLLVENSNRFVKGRYFLYLGIRSKSTNVIWEDAYRFEIRDYMEDTFSRYQAESYRLPGQYSNHFMKYGITIVLGDQVTDKDLSTLRKAFSN